MPTPISPADIAAHIRRRDRAFKSVIAAAGPPPTRRSAPVADRYATLARSITSQLLATKAADTIHGRVNQLCGGTVTIDAIIDAGAAQLRTAGLSLTKAQAMVDLAQNVREGRVRLARHGRMSDAEVVRDVTAVRGIGPWTAQMYLMGTLARPDVWPAGDYGVRHGWSITHGLDELISERELREAGDVFAGVRSSVAWYCWQAVHFGRSAN